MRVLWPERVEDGSCAYKRDFALLQPIAERRPVFPTLMGLLPVIMNTSYRKNRPLARALHFGSSRFFCSPALGKPESYH
jgi:hypothetical protein